ncbi:MAG: hypothetical protein K0R00_29 [Herbinix sp.]|jgi:excisionase family DNA binding protein|nr:hypothetical protein [Herbinix sp.]
MTEVMKEAMKELEVLRKQEERVKTIIFNELADKDGPMLEEGFTIHAKKFSSVEVAKLLGVHVHTLRRWIQSGKLVAETGMGPHGIQIHEWALKEFIRKNREVFI